MSLLNEKTGIDQYMRKLIEKIGVEYEEQGSSNVHINEALKTASKSLSGNVGKPEFIFFSQDFLVVVEDKRDLSKLCKLDNEGNVANDKKSIMDYAVNGAVHYANHILKKTEAIDKVFAVGAVGDSSHNEIQIVYVDRFMEKILPKVNNLEDLRPDRIDEFYRVAVKDELPKEERDLRNVKKIAAELHEDLRNYGSLEGEKKATVVSAILLALEEESFNIDNLKSINREGAKDGDIIFNAVEIYLRNSGITPYAKIGELLDQFNFLKTDITLNTKEERLNETPLKFFTRKLKHELFDKIKHTDIDVLGNFYGEFVKYGGSDGNSLGIVLTPRHITNLMVDIIDVNKDDYVLDPTCGSGSFLITAMIKMLNQCDNEEEEKDVKENRIFGIELQQKLFTIATTNMILRGDGKSNLERNNMFNTELDILKDKKITKVLINPPYSQAKTKELHYLAEINFIKESLKFIKKGGKLAAIVPQSTMAGVTKEDRAKKKQILKENTLESVITLNENTFHKIGTNPCIAVFTAGKKHPKKKKVKFINFKDDGYVIKKHIGLVGDGTEKSKKKFLLDVLKGYETADTSFLVETTIKDTDEWLHSYYYFDDTPPTIDKFKQTMVDYLIFEFSMKAQNRDYLFNNDGDGLSDE